MHRIAQERALSTTRRTAQPAYGILIGMRADTTLAVGAARALGLVWSNDWPLVAACLLAEGRDGPSLRELASLTHGASPWEVDELLHDALADAGVPDVELERAGEVVARIIAQDAWRERRAPDHPIIRTLASLGPSYDYPGGVIAQAYYASEWLECACHRVSPERDAADALEQQLRFLPAPDADDELIAALSCTLCPRISSASSARDSVIAHPSPAAARAARLAIQSRAASADGSGTVLQDRVFTAWSRE